MRRIGPLTRRWLAAITLAAAVYCSTFALAPWLERAGSPAGSWLRLAFAPTCHQQPDRCLDLGDGPLAVCARCAGLYVGGLLGLLATVLSGVRRRPTASVLLAASLPTVLDVAVGLIGLPGLPNWPRFFIAMAPGAVVGLLLADAIADLAERVGPPPVSEGRDPVQ
jgi:uncharacterized membrane protein